MEPLDHTQADDSLEIDLTGVSLAPAPISPGAYLFTVKSAEKRENKQQTGFNYVVEFELAVPAVSTKNVAAGLYDVQDIPPGRTITKWFPLQQSDNPKAPDFRADIIRFYMAVFNANQNDIPPFSTGRTDIIGKPIVLTLKASPARDGYAEGNDIAKMSPAV